jgi:pyruvate/2-oxoglutarate dehydrogenase complex dihydrolipoamide acyltransferase (E2) component
MTDNSGSFQIIDLPPGRRIWLNTLELSWRPHTIYGQLEVDVTLIRQFIAQHKISTGETLSFTGYLTFCMARAVDEDKSVQAYMKGSRQLVIFENVDVGMMIEHTAGENKALMGHVIRDANHKTYRQIHDEIRLVQSAPLPSGRGMPTWYRSAMLLPRPLSTIFKALLKIAVNRNPSILVSMAGTVSVTSVGMFGHGHSGWGLTPTGTPLGMVVGGTAMKPAVVEGRIEPRELLSLTVVFDHDIIDGAPAARFTRRLVELIESGYGLVGMDEN